MEIVGFFVFDIYSKREYSGSKSSVMANKKEIKSKKSRSKKAKLISANKKKRTQRVFLGLSSHDNPLTGFPGIGM